jgi:hypothetical protein
MDAKFNGASHQGRVWSYQHHRKMAADLTETPEAVQPSEDTLPWEQVGMAFSNGTAAAGQ